MKEFFRPNKFKIIFTALFFAIGAGIIAGLIFIGAESSFLGKILAFFYIPVVFAATVVALEPLFTGFLLVLFSILYAYFWSSAVYFILNRINSRIFQRGIRSR